ncbi:ATP-dependent RNA helicase Ddx1 [Dendroctonus ponderosae]|uniref:ATP-dependent RNA helicase Ddx1 n=1 Tax=Dendroctonus ponderosae TaxID=77166 RepID=UPI0020360372|nr:ATP-dependent RNA helicase Ddx1 [Dendroctonus ponderosae]
MAAFEEFGVLPELAKAIEELEWTLPTDIQAESIPLMLGGGDILMAAETGSGKTAAFCLPIIQIVWETLKDIQSGKASKAATAISPAWTLSTHDRGNALAVAPDGLRVQSRDVKDWHGVRCTRGISGGGKWGFEATIADEGLCRMGWATLNATLELGTDRFGWGFGGTGKKSNNRKFDTYGTAFGKSDVITCLVDLDAGEISFMKNGTHLGLAFSGVNTKEPVFPAAVLKNAEMSFNFGDHPFKHNLPEKFLPLASAPKDKVVMNTNTGSGSSDGLVKLANNAPQALIIEPSRELAEQTSNQIKLFKKYIENPCIKDLLVIGGSNIKEQMSILQNSGVDIVVGTPGRLEDLIQGGYMSLANCRFFVLDEADGLLKQGYTDFIERLHKQMPKITADGKRLQMIVCSATLHDFEVKKMAQKLMHFPTWIDLKGEDAVPETVHHVVVQVDPQNDRTWQNIRKHITTDGVHHQDNVKPGDNSPETLSEAVKILKGDYVVKAIMEHQMDKAIIFCRTKLDCDNLEQYLKEIDPSYTCVCLHGDRKPHERKANLELFKNNEVKFLICTDVAARGLDIVGLPFMINVTLPDEKSNYVHRIGRVGRADRMGLAISLVSTVPEKVWYHGAWCKSHGRNCWNTFLTDAKGCCIWYDEPRYLGEIEEHLNVTIQQIGTDLKVPHDEFDGKVVYGQKKQQTASNYASHTAQMAPIVSDLTKLESQAQILYLKRYLNKTARVV